MQNNKTLNRIKIRDLFAMIKNNLKTESRLQLLIAEHVARKEKELLENATEEDVIEARNFYVEKTIGISYYPASEKKLIKGKILPIDSDLRTHPNPLL